MKKFLISLIFLFPFVSHASISVINSPINSLSDGLVGYWTFDGKNMPQGQVNDISGQGRNGSLVGFSTSTDYIAGKIGQGLNFDGVNNQVIVPAFALPSTGTISFWMKKNLSGVWEQTGCILSKRTDMIVHPNGGGATIQFYGAGTTLMNTVTPTNVNAWNHYVWTVDGTNSIVYENGTVLNTAATATLLGTGSTALYMGQDSTVGGRYCNIKLDDVRIYNRVLLPQQVLELYNISSSLHVGNSPVNSVANGLVGYWTFDGKNTDWSSNTTNDISGQANTGTMTNMSTTTSPVFGKIGQALNFDGVDDFVNLGTGTFGIPAGSTGITISAWVKVRTFKSYAAIITKSVTSSPFGGWQLNTNADTGNKFDFAANISGSWRGIVSDGSGSQNYSTNTWYHVVGTYDGTTLRKYVNAAPDGTASFSGTIQYQDSAASAFIGKNPFGTFFDGTVDDVRIYNRALSAQEVKLLYNASSSFHTTFSPVNSISSGLVGYWTFDGKNMPQGQVNDISGQGNNGSMRSMSTSTAYIAGKIGQGLFFDGLAGHWVTVGNATIPSTNFTVSAWINIGANNSGFKTILTNVTGGFYVNSRKISWFEGAEKVIGSTTIPTNTWTHVVVTSDGTNLIGYVNGVKENTVAFASSGITGGGLAIGGPTNIQVFNGFIDDVRIYNRPLSSGEINILYNVTK